MARKRNNTAWRILSSQVLSTSGTANNTAALTSPSGVVRLVATQNVRFAIGPDVVATSTSTRLVANKEGEYFAFNVGDRVSVIQETAGGSFTVTIMSR